MSIFYIIVLLAMVNAVCQLFVGLIQIIGDIEMRTASTMIENIVKIIRNMIT